MPLFATDQDETRLIRLLVEGLKIRTVKQVTAIGKQFRGTQLLMIEDGEAVRLRMHINKQAVEK